MFFLLIERRQIVRIVKKAPPLSQGIDLRTGATQNSAQGGAILDLKMAAGRPRTVPPPENISGSNADVGQILTMLTAIIPRFSNVANPIGQLKMTPHGRHIGF
jgi:hypothetical protein